MTFNHQLHVCKVSKFEKLKISEKNQCQLPKNIGKIDVQILHMHTNPSQHPISCVSIPYLYLKAKQNLSVSVCKQITYCFSKNIITIIYV